MKNALNYLRPLLALFAVALFSFSGCNCSADVPGEDATPCESDEECADDEECIGGYCEEVSDDGDVGVSDAGDDVDPTPDAGPEPDADDDTDADAGDDPEPCPDPNTCEDEGVDCGWIADGCGGTVDCGSCPDGEVCGTGDNAGICVETDCEPSADCAEADVDCGLIPDGCGGFVDCGTCGGEQYCAAEGTDAGQCIAFSCDPLDCDDYSPGECGPHPDGCGGYIDCGTCDSGEVCGTGGEMGECIEPDCDPLDCDDYPDVNCGVMADGCGGLTDSCGDCEDPEICGGGGQPNVCGAEAGGGDCVNLCEDQAVCSSGEATTVTGTVYAPNADLPIPNATVYVPNDPLDELPDVEAATDCVQCEDIDLGNPLVGTTTEYDGTFELRHVPADTEFPLVIKIGQWRRVVMIDPVDACETEQLSADQTRLPTSHQEQTEHDHIPKVAVTTGRVDAMECVFHKLGVAQSEFTRHYQNGRIHVLRANGGVVDQELSDACQNVGCSFGIDFWTGQIIETCHDRDPGSCGTSNDGLMLQDNLSHNLYTDPNAMDDYDMVVMGCEGRDHSDYRSNAELENLRGYVDSGGRLFASHFAYDWLHETDDLEDTAVWGGDSGVGLDEGLAFVDDTHSDGSTFWDWLQLVDADYDQTGPSGEPQIEIQEPRTYVQDIDYSLSTRWVYTDGGAPGHPDVDSIQQYSFNTPVYDDADDQCGQVAYSAFHVADIGGSTPLAEGPAFPSYCAGTELTPQEKVLAYMLFDLTACVTEDDDPPEPECEPLECSDHDDVECGLVSDGCGDYIDCGDCPPGSACGAGGEPNVCSGECTPMDCDDHSAECGEVDDGCGGTIDCGDCPDGESCGAGGTPNICGCETLSCDDHEADCGEVDDGCGGTIDCGTCPAPETCGAGGEPNVCACAALTCDDHSAECGEVDDGCGGTADCGDCPEGYECEDLQCVEAECRPLGAPCETDSQCCSDTCGQDSEGNNACITG